MKVTFCLAVAFICLSCSTSTKVFEDRPYKGPLFCTLPQEEGECRGYFQSWYYDVKSGECKEFVYGGCHGNKNRFDTKDECEQKCKIALKPTKQSGQSGSNIRSLDDSDDKRLDENLLKRWIASKFMSHHRRQKRQPGGGNTYDTDENQKPMNSQTEVRDDNDEAGPHEPAAQKEDQNHNDVGGIQLKTKKQRVSKYNPGKKHMSQNILPIKPIIRNDQEVNLKLTNSGRAGASSRKGIINKKKRKPTKSTKKPPTSLVTTVTTISEDPEMPPTSPHHASVVSTKIASTATEESTVDSSLSNASPATTKTTTRTKTRAPGPVAPSTESIINTIKTTAIATEESTVDSSLGNASPATTKTTTRTKTSTPGPVAPSTESIINTIKTTAIATEESTVDSSLGNASPATTKTTTRTKTRAPAPTAPSKKDVTTIKTTAIPTEEIPDTDGDQNNGKDNSEGNQVPDSSSNKNTGSGNYRPISDEEHKSSHFAAFFLSSIVAVFAVYFIYHNRQKIVAVVIEGRINASRRSPRYRKLETNVEEAMPTMKKYVA